MRPIAPTPARPRANTQCESNPSPCLAAVAELMVVVAVIRPPVCPTCSVQRWAKRLGDELRYFANNVTRYQRLHEVMS